MKVRKFMLAGLAAIQVLALSACQTAEKDKEAEPKAEVNTEETGQEAEEPDVGFHNFKTVDLDGNEVTQELFAAYDLTMINIWGTFCGPCLKEMPELGELSREYKDKGVQIVGVVIDVLDENGNISESQLETARDAVEQTGADYPHLLPSMDLIKAKLQYVVGVPETIFVDKEGRVVGESYVGARDKDAWQAVIEEVEASMK